MVRHCLMWRVRSRLREAGRRARFRLVSRLFSGALTCFGSRAGHRARASRDGRCLVYCDLPGVVIRACPGPGKWGLPSRRCGCRPRQAVVGAGLSGLVAEAAHAFAVALGQAPGAMTLVHAAKRVPLGRIVACSCAVAHLCNLFLSEYLKLPHGTIIPHPVAPKGGSIMPRIQGRNTYGARKENAQKLWPSRSSAVYSPGKLSHPAALLTPTQQGRGRQR